MTIPSRWIFHQHTICSLWFIPWLFPPFDSWFCSASCLIYEGSLTFFSYLLIQDYIHHHHHVIDFFSLQANFLIFFRWFSILFLGIFWSWNLGPKKKTAQERCLQVQSQLVGLCGSEFSWGFGSRKAPWNRRQFVCQNRPGCVWKWLVPLKPMGFMIIILNG